MFKLCLLCLNCLNYCIALNVGPGIYLFLSNDFSPWPLSKTAYEQIWLFYAILVNYFLVNCIWILGHKDLMFFIHYDALQRATQRSNSSWWVPWFTKYTKASEQLEHAMVNICMYIFHFAQHLSLKLARSVCACTYQTYRRFPRDPLLISIFRKP